MPLSITLLAAPAIVLAAVALWRLLSRRAKHADGIAGFTTLGESSAAGESGHAGDGRAGACGGVA